MSDKMVIDLTDRSLTEVYVYSRFSNQVNTLLQGLYQAGIDIPLTVRGSQNQVESFFQSLRGEKRYMDSYIKYGLNDPRTLNNRANLMDSIKNFERETGLHWPFKN